MESNRREFLIPWLTNVGYLSQKPFLFKGNVHENLTLGNPDIAIDDVLTSNLVNNLDLSKQLGPEPLLYELAEGGDNLSGGQQQRLALLRALQVKRPVLILDEATSALDSAMRDVVFDLLREQANDGATVILVTHDKELASKCDDILDLG
jgi:ABC-type bacteriocin/lantibiotic exporter with double-glycine peptidase domain